MTLQRANTPATLLIINGPAGVGKSTISSLLVQNREGSAYVCGDQLKEFVINKPDDSRATRITYRNGAAVCHELLASGFRFVVFDFVFNNRETKTDFLSRVRPAVPFVSIFVTLWAGFDVNNARRRSRVEDSRYVNMMNDSWHRMESHLHELGVVIDTNNQTPEQVATTIESLMQIQDNQNQGVPPGT